MTALLRAVLALALVAFVNPVHAQNADYPNRPIKLLVGFAAGSIFNHIHIPLSACPGTPQMIR